MKQQTLNSPFSKAEQPFACKRYATSGVGVPHHKSHLDDSRKVGCKDLVHHYRVATLASSSIKLQAFASYRAECVQLLVVSAQMEKTRSSKQRGFSHEARSPGVEDCERSNDVFMMITILRYRKCISSSNSADHLLRLRSEVRALVT
eukprot:2821113-Pleurochrysis_carterae.AAC.5